MAGYREHISVSGMLGLGYGAGATLVLGFTPTQGMIAASLTWIAGMLPDLDAEGGKPIRELFSIVAAVAPLMLMRYFEQIGGDTERALLFGILMYALVRYGGSTLLGQLSVHRGMFHSIPALVIAAELTFLGYRHPDNQVRLLMATGVGVGFLSHLLLDEMYSVQWNGARLKLKRSAGTALKFVGAHFLPNTLCYGLVMFLTYAVLVHVEILHEPGEQIVAPELLREATNVEDAPIYH